MCILPLTIKYILCDRDDISLLYCRPSRCCFVNINETEILLHRAYKNIKKINITALRFCHDHIIIIIIIYNFNKNNLILNYYYYYYYPLTIKIFYWRQNENFLCNVLVNWIANRFIARRK